MKWKRVNSLDVILEPNDTVVIVDLATGRAMSNDKGTKDPDAVAVDLNDDKDRILGDVAEKVKWAFTSNEGYKFAVGENNLYAVSDGLSHATRGRAKRSAAGKESPTAPRGCRRRSPRTGIRTPCRRIP